MKKVLFGIITLIFLSSCSNDNLTSAVALEILKNNYKNNCYQDLAGGRYYWYGSYYQRVKNSAEMLKKIKNLKQKGYINSYEEIFDGRDLKFYYSNKINNFKKNNSKNIYEVAKSEVTEVIGVSNNESNNTATVRFKYILIPNDLYEVRKNYQKSSKDNCKLREYEQEVEFIKYDTGWKIK